MQDLIIKEIGVRLSIFTVRGFSYVPVYLDKQAMLPRP